MRNKGFEKVNTKEPKFKKVKSAKERNLYVNKVACPECGSMKTTANNPGTYIVGAGLMITVSSLIAFSCCLWIPIFGWALLIPFGIGIFLGLVVFAIGSILTAFIRTLTFKCEECNSIQKINSKDYKEMAKEYMAQM